MNSFIESAAIPLIKTPNIKTFSFTEILIFIHPYCAALLPCPLLKKNLFLISQTATSCREGEYHVSVTVRPCIWGNEASQIYLKLFSILYLNFLYERKILFLRGAVLAKSYGLFKVCSRISRFSVRNVILLQTAENCLSIRKKCKYNWKRWKLVF